MADVLSQSEIDALLSALSSGDVEAESITEKDEEKHKIKDYDFKSPQKFSKEHIRTLEKVHDNFGRLTGNYLSGQLRQNVKIKIESVEQVTYDEFIRSLPNPTIISYFRMLPLQGNILLEMNPQFAFQILEILLGGSGIRKNITKELTEIEKNIISQACKGIIDNFKMAWGEVLEVDPIFDCIETNPSANQTLAPNEPVALLTFSVELGGMNTYLNVCIPYLAIEKVLDRLVAQRWFQSSNDEDREVVEKNIKRSLDTVSVNIHAELGKTHISVNDFLMMMVGDVIKLDAKIDNPVKVFVEDEACYIGKPGIVGKNLGIELLDCTNKDVNEDE